VGSRRSRILAPYLGARAITARYGGDARFFGSYSDPAPLHVVPTAKPGITGITDVKNDQGGQVRMRFRRSPFDYAGSETPIQRYDAYRRILPGALIGAPLASRPVAARESDPAHVQLEGWEYVATTPASGDSAYSLVVTTLADSNGSGFHRSTFFVRGVTSVVTTCRLGLLRRQPAAVAAGSVRGGLHRRRDAPPLVAQR
jgi:hypothetical protein